jgi:hypothetical protein
MRKKQRPAGQGVVFFTSDEEGAAGMAAFKDVGGRNETSYGNTNRPRR